MDIIRIASVTPTTDLCLRVAFDNGKEVLYDVGEDVDTIPAFLPLRTVADLFEQVQIDASRTCVYWNDEIDLPSDAIYEYGVAVTHIKSYSDVV